MACPDSSFPQIEGSDRDRDRHQTRVRVEGDGEPGTTRRGATWAEGSFPESRPSLPRTAPGTHVRPEPTIAATEPLSGSRPSRSTFGQANPGTEMGPYRIVRYIDRGGMGFVYEGFDDSLKRPVAIKTIRPELNSPADIERFLIEARAVARLHAHPSIVKIYGIHVEGEEPFFVMQLIRGGSLKGRKEFQEEPRRAVEVMLRAGDAITHAHRKGILHRDLKPDNILLDEDGSPYVTDFGLAKRVDPSEGGTVAVSPTLGIHRGNERFDPSRSEADQEGSRLGTPSYMPPEQAEGRQKDVTILSDVYGLGATLFALLCGRPPYVGASINDILTQVVEAPVPSARALNSRIDADLDAICRKSLAKRPADRYPSAEAMTRDLRRWLEGRPVQARPLPLLERSVRWARREPARFTSVVLAGGMVASLAGMTFQELRRRESMARAEVEDRHHRDLERIREENRRAVAQAEKAQAERKLTSAYASAGDAVAELVDHLEGEFDPDPRQDPARIKMLRAAHKYFLQVIDSKTRDQAVKTPQDQLNLARDYLKVAELTPKIDPVNRDIDPFFEKAIGILETLSRLPHLSAEDRHAALSTLGHAHHDYGVLISTRGNDEQAFERFRRGAAVREALCPPCDEHAGARDGCGGRPDDRAALGESHGWLGDYHANIGHLKDARAEYEASHRIRERLFRDLPEGGKADPKERMRVTLNLARSFENLSNLARSEGDLPQSIAYRQQGDDLLRPLVDGELDRDRREIVEEYARGLHNLGELQFEADLANRVAEPASALPALDDSIALFGRLVDKRGGVEEYRYLQADAEVARGLVLLQSGRVDDAARSCDLARDRLAITEYSREDRERRFALARLRLVSGRIALRRGDHGLAAGLLRGAIEEANRLIDGSGRINEYLSLRAEINAALALALRDAGDAAQARASLDAAIREGWDVVERAGRTQLFFDRLREYKDLRQTLGASASR